MLTPSPLSAQDSCSKVAWTLKPSRSKTTCLSFDKPAFAAGVHVSAAVVVALHCRLDASKWGLVRSRSVTRAAAAGTFPCQLCTSSVTSGKACQDLVTTGSRLFGLGGFGSALRVRIYDFAVYIHPEQVCAICSHGCRKHKRSLLRHALWSESECLPPECSMHALQAPCHKLFVTSFTLKFYVIVQRAAHCKCHDLLFQSTTLG